MNQSSEREERRLTDEMPIGMHHEEHEGHGEVDRPTLRALRVLRGERTSQANEKNDGSLTRCRSESTTKSTKDTERWTGQHFVLFVSFVVK
jgi:hypothetical protein